MMERKIPALFLALLPIFFFFLLSLNAQAELNSNKSYDGLIQTLSGKYGVDSSLVHSIIQAESNYNSRAVSPKGACGLMQLMPKTVKQYGVKDPFDPRENIEGGIKLLKDLIKAYDGNTELVLAAYNAGQEAIKKYGGIPPYSETRKYIKRVKTEYKKSSVSRTKIYVFYDEKGKAVFTNDKNYYLKMKK
jgi:soluble lytic murein transglycosylase-like protein